MKISIRLMPAALGLGALCLAAASHDRWTIREQETTQRTLTLSGEPLRVVIENVEGYVHVTGASGSKVEVTAHKTIRAESQSDVQQANNEVKLEYAEQPGMVSIRYDTPRNSGDRRRFYEVTYDLDVEVPREARTVASTVNGGDVRIDGVSGDFEAKNVNGGIRMNEISGSGDAHTVNGPIAVHFAKNPARACSFKSVNGPLDVYFSQEPSADLLFKTMNGGVYSDFDVTARAAPAATTERRDGKFVYRSNRLNGARVGGGGPELSFDTLNGSIRLHRGELP